MSYPDPEARKPKSAARRMPFRAPRPSSFVIRQCTRLLPRIMRKGYGIESVGYQDAELRRLQELIKEHRVLITPNHPTHAEPVVLFHLSRQIETDFYYLSNRESFDRYWGLFGWLLTRTGAYSILRGVPDRESFKFTRKVLAERIAPLVIFPEGEVYSQNDSLLPFQAGVFQ
ncbi:MAG TPA: 1-acyl-sn-glycerol-3-phosphate acyltransferase, partial [Fimbriimonadaceae bacterium]|nr:1-acyl-sn-glycerol-3-phosphate acyltransferase [Fimbriimonadaceae bacterium]